MNYGLKSWQKFINEPFKGDRFEAEKILLRNTVYLDVNRKQSFLEVNPQYEEWFKEIRKNLNEKQHRWLILPKLRKGELESQQLQLEKKHWVPKGKGLI